MTENEMLASKSHSDLVEISVAFGDWSLEEAQSKTREELIEAITKTPVDEAKPPIKAPAKTKRSSKKETKEEPKGKDTIPPKKESKSKSKKVSNVTKVEEVPETSVKPVTEVVPKTQPKKTKTRTSTPKQIPIEEVQTTEIENTAEQVVIPEPVVKETNSPTKENNKKNNNRRSKKSNNEQKSSEVSLSTQVSSITIEKKSLKNPNNNSINSINSNNANNANNSNNASNGSNGSNAKNTNSATNANVNNQQRKQVNTKRRRLSFGPSQELVQVDVNANEELDNGDSDRPTQQEPELVLTEISGILSVGGLDKGEFCGFVHTNNYLPGEQDAYVPGQMIRRMRLRKGDAIVGLVSPVRGKEKYTPLKKVISVNGIPINDDNDIEFLKKRSRFENLTAIYPDERLVLETGAHDISTRIIDLFCPIGRGQRGMIVSPPKAGKTILLKKIANAISTNSPKSKLIVLLIDERPEEVTDMQRSINGEVVYSTFDKKPENHVRVTELVLERAMRLVELGQDVVILLDSMTRLARAYNLTINPTGRTLSGGLDPGSLYGPKRFFGAARNVENGGSLTIIATALIETGSRMDEVIFEEFKGTGNMEVTLDRKLADRRIYPAIAVDKSGTRREDLLLSKEELEAIWLLRKQIADVDTTTATDAVISFMKKTISNESFVLSVKKSFSID